MICIPNDQLPHYLKLLFEFLILEGAQAGLSLITILRKERRSGSL